MDARTDVITFGVIENEVRQQLEKLGVKPIKILSGPHPDGFFLEVQTDKRVAIVTMALSPWNGEHWKKIYIEPAVFQIHQHLTEGQNAR